MKFFEHIAPRCTVIAVDDFESDMAYANKVRQWALDHGYEVQIMGRAALLMRAGSVSLAA